MKKEDKEKNILDLRYQKGLNYLNIFIIFIITIFVAILVNQWEFLSLTKIFSYIYLGFSFCFVAWLIFENFSKKIHREIRKL